MIKKSSIILLWAFLGLASCTPAYDDSSIQDEIAALKKRMTEIEGKIKNINSDISVLQDLVAAVQTGKQIVSAKQVTKDGETFWELVFSDKSVITIRNGKDGKDGKDGQDGQDGQDGKDGKDGQDGKDGKSPVVGVKQYKDGLWYWTIDGEWMLDGNGNMILASAVNGKDGQDGQDGVTPQLKVENGFWWVSYDKGSTWIKLYAYSEGSSGDSGPILDIDTTSSDRYVILYLKGGGTVLLPRRVQLSISFDREEVQVSAPGAKEEVSYTLTGGTLANVVKAICQGGWVAKVTAQSAYSGTISLTAPYPLTESEVIVLANDGEGYTVMASINCVISSPHVIPQAFGIWDSEGQSIYSYDPSVAQMSLYQAIGESWFRFVEPQSLLVRELGPLPENPEQGSVFPATFSLMQSGETVESQELSLSVVAKDQEKLILSSADDTYYVIRF